jgi:2-polyprenyl-3-methyl-5-hydroxy-6-metoxy-1,4-benzoquinol methylase
MNYEAGSISKDRVYMLDPKKITLAMKEEFLIHTHRGKILGGDWEIVPFAQKVDFYDSFAHRLRHNTPWEETAYFKRVMGEINRGISKWGCRNREQFLRRCAELDGIYRNMKENGFQQDPDVDYIEINIDAYGRLVFNNGRHRLTMAKLLELPEVPVRITVRHEQWEKFKNEIRKYRDTHGGYVYAPLGHMDLQQFEVLHTGRFELLKAHIKPDSETVLDIGANWGYMCRRFEESGLECFAVENALLHLHFLKKLKQANQNRFHVVDQDIFDYIKTGNHFDTVLALSIFHHFLKTEKAFTRFKTMLENLDADEMFFQAHKPTENQMKDAYINFHPEEFADFILQHTVFEQCRQIGDFDGRIMFHLYREK